MCTQSAEEPTITVKDQIEIEEKRIGDLRIRIAGLRKKVSPLIFPYFYARYTIQKEILQRQQESRSKNEDPSMPDIIPIPTPKLPRQTARRLSRLPVGPNMAKTRIPRASIALPTESEDASYEHEERVFQETARVDQNYTEREEVERDPDPGTTDIRGEQELDLVEDDDDDGGDDFSTQSVEGDTAILGDSTPSISRKMPPSAIPTQPETESPRITTPKPTLSRIEPSTPTSTPTPGKKTRGIKITPEVESITVSLIFSYPPLN